MSFKYHDRGVEKRYRVVEVAKAIALSEGAVESSANRILGTGIKSGLTMQQIAEICKSRKPRHGEVRGDVRWREVQKIRQDLFDTYGIEVIESEEENVPNQIAIQLDPASEEKQ